MKVLLIRLLLFSYFLLCIHNSWFVEMFVVLSVVLLLELRLFYIRSKYRVDNKLDLMCSITTLNISEEEKSSIRSKIVSEMNFLEKIIYRRIRGE